MSVDKSNSRVQKMFGEIAPRYDLMNHLLSMNVDRYWRWRTVRMAPPENSAPILDVCTGTGDLALAYHRYAAGQLPVVATDFCPEMLQIGRRKRDRAGIDRLDFITADTQDLPFDSDTFQLVTVAFGLRNVCDTDTGLREMVRVCRPGGRVVILEFSLPQNSLLRGLYTWYFHRVLPTIGQWFARNRQDAYNYLPESVSHFPSGSELAERMRQAGLTEVDFQSFTFGIATLYVGRKVLPITVPSELTTVRRETLPA